MASAGRARRWSIWRIAFGGRLKQTFAVATVTLTVALDFVLTFVPSALVFTTPSAREALSSAGG